MDEVTAPSVDDAREQPPGGLNIWFRRCLVILSIGGGFLGVILTVQAFLQAPGSAVLGYGMAGLMIAFNLYGIVAGLRLAESAQHYGHMICFFALQVPFFSSPFLLYRFGCGLEATVALVGFQTGWSFQFGNGFQFAILQPHPWGIGINLFATAVLFALLMHAWLEGALPDQAPMTKTKPEPYDY